MKTKGCQIMLFSSLLFTAHKVIAKPNQAEAIADYNRGQYRSALQRFNQVKKEVPGDVTARYYAALCEQNLNLMTDARADYEWVARYGGEPLRSYALRGLATVSKMGGSAGYSSSQRGAAPPPAGATFPGGGGRPTSQAKVKKILEFYTTWCHVCKEFAPIFQEAQRHFRNVQFVSVNAEEDASLAHQYGVKAYPTLVYLDASGKVILNESGAPETLADFEASIVANGGEK